MSPHRHQLAPLPLPGERRPLSNKLEPVDKTAEERSSKAREKVKRRRRKHQLSEEITSPESAAKVLNVDPSIPSPRPFGKTLLHKADTSEEEGSPFKAPKASPLSRDPFSESDPETPRVPAVEEDQPQVEIEDEKPVSINDDEQGQAKIAEDDPFVFAGKAAKEMSEQTTKADASSPRHYFDLVLVFDLADKDASKAKFKGGVAELTYSSLSAIFDQLREEGLSLYYEKDNNELANKKEAKKERVFVLLTASQKELEEEAEKMNLRKPLKIPKIVAEEFNLPEFASGMPFRAIYAKITAPFTIARKVQFHESSLLTDSGDFVVNPRQCQFPFFNEGERQILVYNMIHSRLSKELLNWESFCEVFPLHQDRLMSEVIRPSSTDNSACTLKMTAVTASVNAVDKHWLIQNWLKALARGRSIVSAVNPIADPTKGVHMPLNEIRRYFGDSIAFYFSWIGCYTKFLFFPALFGIVFFVLRETLSREGWQNVTLTPEEYLAIPKAPIDPFVALNTSWSLMIIFWATCFQSFWLRRQSVLAFRWNTFDLMTAEKIRPKYFGIPVKNRLTLREELVYSSVKRTLKQIFSLGVLGVMVIAVGIIFVQVIVFRFTGTFLQSDESIPFLQKYGATFVNSVSIIILSMVYRRIAIKLTDWENYKYQSAYDNALILKSFCFEFVNSFTAVLYLAFFRGAFNADGTPVPSPSGVFPLLLDTKRMGDLATQVAMNILVKFAVSNGKEIIMPFLLSRLKKCKNRKKNDQSQMEKDKEDVEAKQTTEDKYMILAKKQANLSAYTNLTLLDDYIEVIILFAYVMFFSTVFPLAPTIVFVASYLELGVDAFKLCHEYRRPIVDRANGIPSSWLTIIRHVCRLAVIINVAIVCFVTPNVFDNLTGLWPRLAIAFTLEHAIFFIQSVLSTIIGKEPIWTTQRRKLNAQVALECIVAASDQKPVDPWSPQYLEDAREGKADSAWNTDVKSARLRRPKAAAVHP